MKTPAYPLHLIAETTPGMHPWERMPGDYDEMSAAERAAWNLAESRQVRVHVNDRRGNFWREVTA